MPYICTLIIILNALLHASLISLTVNMCDIFIVLYLYHSLYCELFIMEEIKNIYLSIYPISFVKIDP